MSEKPIVEIRALDFQWVEVGGDGHGVEVVAKSNWRIQIRREGETEWRPIPIVKIHGQPPADETEAP